MIRFNTTRMIAVVGTLLSLPSSPAHAGKIHVPGRYPDIQAGINAATDGDVVIVADGVYIGPGNRNIDFLGKAITVRSSNGPEHCIIDCQSLGRGFVFRNNETETSVLKGFTITNGSAANGAGIYGDGGNPRILNCTITGNTASQDGGGIYGVGGSIVGCRIIKNKASYGGGIAASGTITDCTITGNLAWNGGGIDYRGGAGIAGCLITGNIARRSAGGIRLAADTTVTNCTITDNAGGSFGGGVSSERGRVSFIHCTFSRNTASLGGGIYLENTNESAVANCLFADNTAYLLGGAAIIIHADVSFSNCTMTRNAALRDGGGVYLVGGSAFTDCILWGNTPEQFYLWGTASAPRVRFCDVEGGWPGDGNIDADPLFVSGPSGAHYLSQIAAGQRFDSPGLDAGSGKARDLGLRAFTTRTDHHRDRGAVDMGYHYRR